MLETKASASGHFKHICNPVHSSRVAEKWNMKVPDWTGRNIINVFILNPGDD